MEKNERPQFNVSFKLESILLPPVSDILVLAKKHPQGKVGIMQAFDFIAPDEFDMIPIGEEDETVEAVLVHKRILRKMSAPQLVAILAEHVFPFVAKGEAVKVDISLRITTGGIVGDLGDQP